MKSPPASFKIILAPNVRLLSHLTDEPEPVMRPTVRIALFPDWVFSGQQKENMRQSVQRAVNRFHGPVQKTLDFGRNPALTMLVFVRIIL